MEAPKDARCYYLTEESAGGADVLLVRLGLLFAKKLGSVYKKTVDCRVLVCGRVIIEYIHDMARFETTSGKKTG